MLKVRVLPAELRKGLRNFVTDQLTRETPRECLSGFFVFRQYFHRFQSRREIDPAVESAARAAGLGFGRENLQTSPLLCPMRPAGKQRSFDRTPVDPHIIAVRHQWRSNPIISKVYSIRKLIIKESCLLAR